MNSALGKQVNVCEPVRRSVFDIISENFKRANRQIYVYRLFYIGKHSFEDAIGDNVSDYFHRIITEVNSKFCDEKLTGFLLYYPRYFCHVIEGSEDTLLKHLRRIVNEPRIGDCKVLCVYHHINQRFISNWTHITAKPATLLEKIDPNSNLEKTSSKIMYCLQKLYKLGNLLRRQEEAQRKAVEDPSLDSTDGPSATFLLSEVQSKERGLSYPALRKEKARDTPAPVFEQVTSACLPEYTVLEFLIETRYTQVLDTYCKSYGTVPNLEEYQDLVWPIASDGIPKDIFDKEFDPINDLPNINVGEVGEAEDVNNLEIV